MKRFLFVLAFLLMAISFASAQGNGNGGNSGYSAWASSGWPQWVATWLQNGGSIPQPLVNRVLLEARDWGRQVHGMSLGQLHQRYAQGLLTIELIPTAPPSLLFRVSYDGGAIIVDLEGL